MFDKHRRRSVPYAGLIRYHSACWVGIRSSINPSIGTGSPMWALLRVATKLTLLQILILLLMAADLS